MMAAYAVLIAATVGLFSITPTGFIPAQDQGYFLTVIQLPSGSSLERTDAVMRKVAARILPIPGVKGAVMLAGFDGASQTQAPNAAAAFKAPPQELPAKISQIMDNVRQLEKELERLKSKMAASQGDDLLQQAVDVAGIKVLAARLENVDAKGLREATTKLLPVPRCTRSKICAAVENVFGCQPCSGS